MTHCFTEGEPDVKIYSLKFDAHDKYIAAGNYFIIKDVKMVPLKFLMSRKRLLPLTFLINLKLHFLI